MNFESRASLLQQAGSSAAHSACKHYRYSMVRGVRASKVDGASILSFPFPRSLADSHCSTITDEA